MKALECATAISFKNILFLTDFSSASEAAFTYAVALARHFGARAYPAHVITPAMPAGFEMPMSPGLLMQEEEVAEAEVHRKLDHLFQNAGVGHQSLMAMAWLRPLSPNGSACMEST